jgi:hypothetical protein
VQVVQAGARPLPSDAGIVPHRAEEHHLTPPEVTIG